MNHKITSVQNPGIKKAVSLRTKKSRKEEGLTLVEGFREVSRALEAGVELEALYFCREGGYTVAADLQRKLRAKNKNVFETSEKVFEKIAYGDRREGVVAVARPRIIGLEDLRLSGRPLIAVIENVEKPGNLGAILRTCDGAGAEALIVTGAATDVYNPNVIRASLGAIFSVPVVEAPREDVLGFLRAKGVRTFAAVVDAEAFYFDLDLSGPAAFVFGSEQGGLSRFWVENADRRIRIPMQGKLDSLNVSVSAAVIIYEAARQRLK